MSDPWEPYNENMRRVTTCAITKIRRRTTSMRKWTHNPSAHFRSILFQMSGMSDTIVYVQTKSPKCPDCYVLTKFSSQKRPRNVRTFKFFTSQKKQGLFVVRFSALLVNVRTFLSNVRILFWNVFGMRTLFWASFLREEFRENCMQPPKGFALGKA